MGLRRVAFIASIGAAALHLAAAGPHLGEWMPAGLFMAGVGSAQLVWAARVARGATDAMLAAGVLMHAGVVGVWLVSRTTGLPFGPAAGMAEHIHGPDALATALESVAIAAGVGMLLGFRRAHPMALCTCVALVSLTPTVASHEPVLERLVVLVTLVVATITIGKDHEATSNRHLVGRPRLPARAGVGARG